MKKFFVFLTAFVCLTACGKQPSEKGPALQLETTSEAAPEQEAPAAQVGPAFISQKELEKRLALLPEEDRKFAKTPIGRRNFLNLMAREKLAILDAKQQNLTHTEAYQTALEEKQRQLQDIYQDFAEELLLRMWEENLQEKGLLQITDKEIEAYYKKYPYEMTIKQIIIPDAQTADIVYRELKHAKNRWKELEKQYSAAPQYSKGKEISFMPGEFIPELEVIAANSPSGSVQGFVKTAQGFHIIMKTGEKRLSLKDATPRIRTILENQKIDAALADLQNKYKVVIYEQDE